jgi:DNA-binding transcriptional MerR regulator
MKIKYFAEKLGVSQYTLRYYEKIGVLRPIKRLQNGYREFGEADIKWMEFVLRLKNTGMPIKNIIKYADLRSEGDKTKIQRKELLEEHEKEIIHRINEQQVNLKKIREKIEFYRKS